MNQAITSWQ